MAIIMTFSPETIHLQSLPSVLLSQRRMLPQTAGIYICMSDDDEKILYTGRSANLAKRWTQHHRYPELIAVSGVRIAWLEISDTHLLPNIEAALIQHFSPALNKRIVPSRQEGTVSDLQTRTRWRLAEIMAKHNISGVALAEALKITPKAVSHIRQSRSMPKINGESLDKLCDALSDLSGKEITPRDLIEYESRKNAISA